MEYGISLNTLSNNVEPSLQRNDNSGICGSKFWVYMTEKEAAPHILSVILVNQHWHQITC